TTLVAQTDFLQDRFEFSPERNANSIRAEAGFDLDPDALVSGRVRFGYRQYVGTGGGVPDYRGPVAAVDTGVTVFRERQVRLQFTGQRDIDYSYDLVYSYYVLTGGTLTVTPRLTQS